MPNLRNGLAGEIALAAGQNGHAVAGADKRLAEFDMSGAARIVGADEKLVEQQDVHAVLFESDPRSCRPSQRPSNRAGILTSRARKGRSRPRRGWPRPASAFAVGAIGYIMWDLAKSSFTISQASCGWPGTLETAK